MKKILTGTVLVFLLTATGGFAETSPVIAVDEGHLISCPKCGFSETGKVTTASAVTNHVPHDWKSSVYGGFAASSGNTVERSYNYGGEYSRDGKVYRGKLKADGRYSKTEEQLTASKDEASGEMRRMLNERWFAYGVLSALHDELKVISYRVKTGPGIGYYFVDTKDLTADISSGPLYVQEKTSGGASGYLAWRVAQDASWQITDTFRWWASTEAVVSTMDYAAYTIAFKTGIEAKINRSLSLIIAFQDDYDSMPEAKDQIKNNDMELKTGIRYTL